MTCKNLGQEIGVADCRCKGKKTVYACPIHTHCMKHRLTPGKVMVEWFATGLKSPVTMNYCFGCPQHTEINFE